MLTFVTALIAAGIDPAAVRLLRHHKVYPGGRTPYSLWRDHRELFEQYQSTQDPERRAYFAAPYWASFVVPPAGYTLFVGLYSANLNGPVPAGMIAPLSGEVPGAAKGRTYNLYDCQRLAPLSEYAGRVLPGGGVDSVDPDLAAAAAAAVAAGGKPRLVAHLRRERKPALAAAKRRAMMEQLGYASPCWAALRESTASTPEWNTA